MQNGYVKLSPHEFISIDGIAKIGITCPQQGAAPRGFLFLDGDRLIGSGPAGKVLPRDLGIRRRPRQD